MDFTRQTLPAQPYLYVERECPYDGPKIAEAMGSAIGEIGAFVAEKGIAALGPPMSIYLGMDPSILRFRTAVPVAAVDAAKAGGAVKADTLPAGDAIATTHVGTYANLNQTHRALWDHMAAEGLSGAFPIWEIYLDDPREVPEEQLRTEIRRAIA